MFMVRAVSPMLLLLVMSGCDSGRLAQLEKQNGEMKSQLDKRNVALDYDLQAKCSKDADLWFRKGFSEDKDTVLLTFENHYNRTINKCFIIVENHFNLGRQTLSISTWENDRSLWDVYENYRYGKFLEEHTYGLNIPASDHVLTCETSGNQKCESMDQWNSLTSSFMSE